MEEREEQVISSRKRNSENEVNNINQERKLEAEQVHRLLMENSTADEISQEGLPVYIISIKWFKTWKKYTSYDKIFQQSMANPGGDHDQDEDEMSKSEINFERRDSMKHPGPINNDDILSKNKFLEDPDPVKAYSNVVLITGLQENRDFIVVSRYVWRTLFHIYGGKEIKRFIVSLNDDAKFTQVELWLKKINLLVLLPETLTVDNPLPLETLYITRKDTIKDLKDKIYRIYQSVYKTPEKKNLNSIPCKIWKLNPNKDNLETIRTNVIHIKKGSNSQILIKGAKFEDINCLEDCDIGENDHLIVDFKWEDFWRISTEEENTRTAKNKCANCGAENNKLYLCECRQVKYCNELCQKTNRTAHKNECNRNKRLFSTTINTIKNLGINLNRSVSSKSKYGLTGLQNLGNTCFMNSSLQCLSSVSDLTEYFLNNEFVKDLNRMNPLGTGGYLVAVYAELVKDMWLGSESSVAPWNFKKVIGKFAPQFSGYNQQDSHELLSYLLDGLHEDLNRVRNKPIVETIESNNKPDEVVSKKSWENFLKRNHSKIVELFAGLYKSTLVCPDCEKVSITFDPFLSISVPIPNLNLVSLEMYLVFRNPNKVPYKILLNVPSSHSTGQITKLLSDETGIPENFMELCFIRDHKIIDYPKKTNTAKYLKEHHGILFAYELHDESFDFKLENDTEYVRIDLSVTTITKKNLLKKISFSRVLYVPQSILLQHAHLMVYKSMRPFIVAYLEKINYKERNYEKEENNEEVLMEEIKDLTLGEQTFYNVYLTDEDGNFSTKKLLESSTAAISELLTDKGDENEHLVLNLSICFSPNIKTEDLKLNKCQEAPFSHHSSGKNAEKREHTIYDCLDQFTREEILDKGNEWFCPGCKAHKQAKKQMELYNTPNILVIHLKRFKNSRISSIGTYYYSSGSSKISSFVDFPVEGLDLSKYVLSNKTKKQTITYDLFAVSNHYGSLGGGHYTAFCKNANDNEWYDFNDSIVSRHNENDVVSQAAYILFYKKRE